jgi:hypothetical protein
MCNIKNIYRVVEKKNGESDNIGDERDVLRDIIIVIMHIVCNYYCDACTLCCNYCDLYTLYCNYTYRVVIIFVTLYFVL